jgi:hypothetical protein
VTEVFPGVPRCLQKNSTVVSLLGRENFLLINFQFKRSPRTIYVHFEYLENWSLGLDLTMQPVRGNLSVHP